MTFLSPYRPQILSLFRIMSGLLILQHSTSEILGFPTSQMSGVSIASLGGIAGVTELIFSVSRLPAFILSGLMAALYSLGFLYLAAAGPGL